MATNLETNDIVDAWDSLEAIPILPSEVSMVLSAPASSVDQPGDESALGTPGALGVTLRHADSPRIAGTHVTFSDTVEAIPAPATRPPGTRGGLLHSDSFWKAATLMGTAIGSVRGKNAKE